MSSVKDSQPGGRPLDIEMAFGDPEALQKAAENMALYPYCMEKDMHCPWVDRCSSDQTWICPLDLEEIIKNAKNH